MIYRKVINSNTLNVHSDSEFGEENGDIINILEIILAPLAGT